MNNLFINLRYLFPPLMNLLLKSKSGVVSVALNDSMDFSQYPIPKLASLFLATFCLIVFLLLTSINLHVNAHSITVSVRFGYFSAPLTFSLLASIFLAPPLFWVAYFIIIITCPCHGVLWDLLKCFFNWFLLTLKSIPTYVISCVEQQETTEAARPSGLSVDHQFVDIEVEANPMQDQPSSE